MLQPKSGYTTQLFLSSSQNLSFSICLQSAVGPFGENEIKERIFLSNIPYFVHYVLVSLLGPPFIGILFGKPSVENYIY